MQEVELARESGACCTMFDGGYKERSASKIEIPNINHRVFRSMMQCIYTGNVDITPDIAQELLQAADQYLLEGLKRLCENAIAQDLTVSSPVSQRSIAARSILCSAPDCGALSPPPSTRLRRGLSSVWRSTAAPA